MAKNLLTRLLKTVPRFEFSSTTQCWGVVNYMKLIQQASNLTTFCSSLVVVQQAKLKYW
jgi:hypothetical protein